MDTRELAWAAGLFDGEGCLHRTRTGHQASLTMTDEDAVRRFADAVGVGKVRYVAFPSLSQPMWRWRTTSFEGVQAIVAKLWYGLSTRRKAKAREVLRFDYQPRG